MTGAPYHVAIRVLRTSFLVGVVR
ncbi:hypothetical protein [Sicyoidochytrium minutum DNA virus]|nr:hypothetical protein [Sicyoidochytrium minutum DNA virus]